jgi:hypothetical protein
MISLDVERAMTREWARKSDVSGWARAEYEFEFISHYDGRDNYRVYRNGRDDGRITLHQRSRILTYGDGSRVLRGELESFNAWKADEWARACAAFPESYSGEFVPYE